MEESQYQSESLFSLSIDPVTKTHLSETARWARFLAIIGMIGIVLMVVGGVAYSIWLSTAVQSLNDRVIREPGSFETAFVFGTAIGFIIMAAIAFFPLMYMLRFSNRMRRALDANDQESLNVSFQNLKIYFRYLGIITIIIIGLWVIRIVMLMLTEMG